MASSTQQQQRAERLVSLAASLRGVTAPPASQPGPAPQPPKSKARQIKWLVLLTLAGVLISIPFIRGLRPVDFLIRRWQTQSSLLADIPAAARVRQLSELGAEGLGLLVTALTDARPRVAEAARDTLALQVQDWKQLPLKDASRRAATLMNHLRRAANQLSPHVASDVREIVAEILHWPVDQDEVDGVALIGDCEYVLAALYRLPPPAASETVDAAVVADESPESSAADEQVAVGTEESSDEQTAQPERRGASLSISDDEADAASVVEVTDELATSAPVAADGPEALVAPQLVAPLPQRTNLSLSPRDTQLKGLTLIDLGKRLVDSEAETVIAAARELAHRGFREQHIHLIERLFDSSAKVRRSALAEIPQTTAFDSRPWLHHLAEDSDVEVRRMAIALMATGSDPDLLRHLREIEMTEKDESILKIIEQTK